MTVKKAPKTDSSKIYELGYILVSSLPDEKIADEVASLKDLLVKNDADVISSEDPILIDLAYSMVKVVSTERQKYGRGYFGWIKFEGEAATLEAVKKVLDLSPTMLRYMIVKTVRENTLLNGKMVLRQEEREEVMAEEAIEGDVPLEVPEVDKAIDELAIV